MQAWHQTDTSSDEYRNSYQGLPVVPHVLLWAQLLSQVTTAERQHYWLSHTAACRLPYAAEGMNTLFAVLPEQALVDLVACAVKHSQMTSV